MTSELPGGLARMGSSLIRVGLGVHAIGALGFWIAQPRGFDLFSRSFVEHQVLVPAVFGVSAAGVAASLLKRAWTLWLSVGILGGFWTGSAGLIVAVGTTSPARLFWPVLFVALAGLGLARRLSRPTSPALLTGGTVVGLGLAAAFWACTWAPPATTWPNLFPDEVRPDLAVTGPAVLEKEGIRVEVIGGGVKISSGSSSAVLYPGFDYDAVSDSGTWSLFQFRSMSVSRWNGGRTEEGTLFLTADNPDFHAVCRIMIGNRSVHVRTRTELRRELAAHLGTVCQLDLTGDAAVEGIPWRLGNSDDRSEFVPFRDGQTRFLRASRREKGPFEVLGSWEPRDPLLTIDGWKVQVRGWSAQGSKRPSPTAGWGVSQACIERAGATFFWELASTSVGRGWHTVRTKAGTYALEAVITPP